MANMCRGEYDLLIDALGCESIRPARGHIALSQRVTTSLYWVPLHSLAEVVLQRCLHSTFSSSSKAVFSRVQMISHLFYSSQYTAFVAKYH